MQDILFLIFAKKRPGVYSNHMKFEKPKPSGESSIEKKPKKEFVLMHPMKSMSVKEMARAAKKEGFRPATVEEFKELLEMAEERGLEPQTAEEFLDLMRPDAPVRIQPRKEDIIAEGQEVTEEGKRLPPKKK
jgi:hypothetical protein